MAQTPGYIAVQLTLTASTATNLYTAVAAAITPAAVPTSCRELFIQNTGGNTGVTLIGDSNVATTRMGVELAVGSATLPAGSRVYGNTGGAAQVPLKSFWLFNAGSSQKVNVEILG
jgi:hypothetical protein